MTTQFGPDLVERLIRPIEVRGSATAGFTLAEARLSDDGRAIVYTFAPGGLRIVVKEKADEPRMAQTASFNVLAPSSGRAPIALGDSERQLLSHVIGLLRENDPGDVEFPPPPDPTPIAIAPPPEPVEPWLEAMKIPGLAPLDDAEPAGRTPTLYLVPGHTGHVRDLGRRALQILARVPLIFVEPDKEAQTANLLDAERIPRGDKRIVAVPETVGEARARLEEAIARGEDACLFGVDEGLPGFLDPGRALQAAAAEIEAASRGKPARLRVRVVGGVSALAMALLRIPVHVERFLFLGGLQASQLDELISFLREGPKTALLFFLNVQSDANTIAPAALARRFAEACITHGAEVFLLCNLTRKNEWMAHLRPGDRADSLPPLDESGGVVMYVPAARDPRLVTRG